MSCKIGGFCPVRTSVRTSVPPLLGLRGLQLGLKPGFGGLQLGLKPGFRGLNPSPRGQQPGFRGLQQCIRRLQPGIRGLQIGLRGLQPGLSGLLSGSLQPGLRGPPARLQRASCQASGVYSQVLGFSNRLQGAISQAPRALSWAQMASARPQYIQPGSRGLLPWPRPLTRLLARSQGL